MTADDLRAYRHLARFLAARVHEPTTQRLRGAVAAIETLVEAVDRLLKERERLERERDTALFDCREWRDRAEERKDQA